MYALKLPDELVHRLYRLREAHRLGPIRRQVLIAVEHYCDDPEREYGVDEMADTAAPRPCSDSPASRKERTR
ncbi:MAG: hypothetical protein ACK47B_12545 [Armatimonadota bacterium]